MLKIFAATTKELLLLRRDRTGLLVLFLMPAILVVLITLVQENVMELTGQKKTQVLFLDLDSTWIREISANPCKNSWQQPPSTLCSGMKGKKISRTSRPP